jgi:hypothetical protein
LMRCLCRPFLSELYLSPTRHVLHRHVLFTSRLNFCFAAPWLLVQLSEVNGDIYAPYTYCSTVWSLLRHNFVIEYCWIHTRLFVFYNTHKQYSPKNASQLI